MAAEEAVADGEVVAEAKPGLFTLTRKKLLILGPVLLLVIGGAGAWYMGFLGGGEEEAASAPAPPPSYFLDLPDITVNLNTTDRRAAYLRISIALELADAGIAAQIEPLMPRIMDAFQVYLREVRPADLEGSAGMYRLKEELRRRINLSVYPAKVDAVLFKEVLIQ